MAERVGRPRSCATPTEVFVFYAPKAAGCGCDTLAEVWVGGKDGPRLVLVAKPEDKMRDSLGAMRSCTD